MRKDQISICPFNEFSDSEFTSNRILIERNDQDENVVEVTLATGSEKEVEGEVVEVIKFEKIAEIDLEEILIDSEYGDHSDPLEVLKNEVNKILFGKGIIANKFFIEETITGYLNKEFKINKLLDQFV